MSSFITFWLLSLVSRKSAILLTESIVSDIRRTIIDHVRQSELHSIERISSAEIFNTLTVDSQNVSDIVDMIWYFLNSLIILGAAIIYLLFVSLYSFIIIVITLTTGVLLYLKNLKSAIELILNARNCEKDLFKSVDTILSGIKELKINKKKSDNFFYSNYSQMVSKIKKIRIRSGFLMAYCILLPYSVWLLSIFFIVFILPHIHLISPYILKQVVPLILFIPITYILELLPFIVLANISLQRLYSFKTGLDNLNNENINIKKNMRMNKFKEYSKIDTLALKNIKFLYTNDNGECLFPLGPINFNFNQGEITFITGGNGSGKSTLLKIITGLYFPLSGSILVNNKEINILDYRKLFTPIFSDYHLFDRIYGVKNPDAGKILDLTEKMGLSQKIKYSDNRFSTYHLSTGQKKRLAMISALMEDRPVYVFDEWAAEQDAAFREYFYRTIIMDLKRNNKIVLCVTHDEKYFHIADKMLCLEYGKIIR
jgi:putative ATP-binding cassette transporter